MQVASWVEEADRRFGHWAIPHLTRYLVMLQLAVWILDQLGSRGFAAMLALDGRMLAFGEVWTIITFMCVPPDTGPILLLLYLWFTWFVGDALEDEWGPGKVNLYFLIGVVALTVTAIFFTDARVSNAMLMGSIILPFGTMFPAFEFLLYFVLPVAARYLAWIFGALAAAAILFGFMDRAVVIASLLPYLLFFGPSFISNWKQEEEARKRRRRFKGE